MLLARDSTICKYTKILFNSCILFYTRFYEDSSISCIQARRKFRNHRFNSWKFSCAAKFPLADRCMSHCAMTPFPTQRSRFNFPHRSGRETNFFWDHYRPAVPFSLPHFVTKGWIGAPNLVKKKFDSLFKSDLNREFE